MTDTKYVAFDVHQATVSAAVLDESGKLITQVTSRGTGAEMARLTIARKLAAVALAIWKSGEAYDETKLSKLAA